MLLPTHVVVFLSIFEYAFGIKKKMYWKCMNMWVEYIRLYKLNIWIEYTTWIYIKLLNSLRGGFLCEVGVALRTNELVYVFVLPYTSYFYIVDWGTGDSKQDRYSQRISMHVVTSDYAAMITNYDIRCWY